MGDADRDHWAGDGCGMRFDRYLVRTALLPTLVLLAVALLMLVANRLLKLLPWLVELELPLGPVLGTLLWLVPSFVLYALPIALWVGWLLGYGRLGSDGELVAAAAAGASPWRLARPAVLSGMLLAIVATLVAQWGYGQGRLRFREGMRALAARYALAAIRPGSLTELPGGLWVARTGEEDDAGVFWLIREPDVVMAARRVSTPADGVLVLREGWFVPRARPTTGVATFATGRIDLGRRWAPGGPPSARERTLAVLWRDPAVGARVEFHQRLALALALALAPGAAFLAAPRRRRSGRSAALVVGVGGLLAYYACFTLGKQLALAGRLPPPLGLWLADAMVALYLVWGFLRRYQPGAP